VFCDLDKTGSEGATTYNATNRSGFNLIAEQQINTEVFKFSEATIYSNLQDKRVNGIERSIVAERVSSFINENLGTNPGEKVIVTQADYDRNPIYGLNQLPSFIRPFPDSFTYELKFLKTYVTALLRNNLKLNLAKTAGYTALWKWNWL
jgi:hypothetical protein